MRANFEGLSVTLEPGSQCVDATDLEDELFLVNSSAKQDQMLTRCSFPRMIPFIMTTLSSCDKSLNAVWSGNG